MEGSRDNLRAPPREKKGEDNGVETATIYSILEAAVRLKMSLLSVMITGSNF